MPINITGEEPLVHLLFYVYHVLFFRKRQATFIIVYRICKTFDVLSKKIIFVTQSYLLNAKTIETQSLKGVISKGKILFFFLIHVFQNFQ